MSLSTNPANKQPASHHSSQCPSKLVDLKTALVLREDYRKRHETVVFTNGCFDILHAGHIQYLHEAKGLGDRLILGLNSDVSVKENKGDLRPIVSEKHREMVLSGLAMIDHIVLFNDKTPIPLIKQLQPDIHVKGGDYTPESLPEYPVVKKYGGIVKILSFLPGVSTSSIIDRIIQIYGPKR